MEGVLWHLLASSRGGPTRTRIVRMLDERPRNPNRLADELDLDYTTVRHHLKTLEENDVVERSSDDYGAPYLLTDAVRTHRDTLEEIVTTVSTEEER
ncbi:MAG: winged helix-turn-helix domain-containing protein [Halobellus sp.]